MQPEKLSREQLVAQIEQLSQQLAEVEAEKTDLEILLETITEHATELENEIYQKNQQMVSYIQQVEIFTAVATAVENNTFQPESLNEVTARDDELGHLARVFAQMVQTINTREQELATANEQLEAILNAVPGFISWINSGGVYMGVNCYLAQHWNLSPDAFIGKEVGFLQGSTQFAEFTRQFLVGSEESASQIVEVHANEGSRYYLIAAQKYQKGSASVSVGIDVTEHKKAEEALRQSEERFRTLISNIPGAIYRCQGDAAWTMEFISDAIAEISGYPASEFIHNQSRTFTSIIHPDDRTAVETIISQAVAKQQSYGLEYRVLHSEGSIRWVTERGRATFDEEDKLLCLDGVIFDITAQKQAEEALRQSEATNRALIEAIPDFLIRVKGDGTYLKIAGCEHINIHDSQHFLPGSSVRDSLPPELAERRMHYIQKALETRALQIYEQRLIINNQPQDEEVRMVVTGNDEVLIIVRDITDRKRAEEALRIAKEKYHSIYENALEGIFQSTPEGRFMSVNPAMARIYGYNSPQEMLESITNIAEQIYVDQKCRDEFKRRMDSSDRVKEFEYRSYQKDGSIIWVDETTRAVRDNCGNLLYYEGIIQDISDRKCREEELRRQLEELKIEIDHKKRKQDVAKITQSDYFQELQAELETLRVDDFWN